MGCGLGSHDQARPAANTDLISAYGRTQQATVTAIHHPLPTDCSTRMPIHFGWLLVEAEVRKGEHCRRTSPFLEKADSSLRIRLSLSGSAAGGGIDGGVGIYINA